MKISDYKRPCIRILGIVEDNMGRAGLTPAGMKVKVKAKQSCKG